jgi:hypothetical protein
MQLPRPLIVGPALRCQMLLHAPWHTCVALAAVQPLAHNHAQPGARTLCALLCMLQMSTGELLKGNCAQQGKARVHGVHGLSGVEAMQVELKQAAGSAACSA